MRPGIHPDYHPVVFRDKAADFAFLTRSTITSPHTIQWEDGNTYPLVDVDISSASHPFWTGKGRILDTAGRVEKFERRYGKRSRRYPPTPLKGDSMKVRASIRSLTRQPGSKVVRRRGHTYVINKKNPRFKARQG